MKRSTKGMHLQSFTVSEKLRIVREEEEIGNRIALLAENTMFLKVV
jgi:hypothetical protein